MAAMRPPLKPRFREGTRAASTDPTPAKKRKLPSAETVWREAREIVWARRGRLSVGLLLMLVSRLAGLVLPASSKFLIDKVLGQKRLDLLLPLAAAVAAATLVQEASYFCLSQIL